MISFLLSAAITATPPSTLPPPPSGQKWSLVFEDQFNRFDPTNWRKLGERPRAGGIETPENASVEDGHLILKTDHRSMTMTFGGLSSQAKREFQFGYFEIRAKLPASPPGHRPAFWLQSQGTFNIGNDGRDGSEIDIFEAWSRDGHVQHNLHWDWNRDTGVQQQVGVLSPITVSYNTWHTFSVWWSPTFYKFYVDGQLSWQTSAGGVSQVPSYMLITDEAIERDKLALLHAIAPIHDPYVIDYVRVYQLKNQ